jgi:hypothetical protein
MSLLSCGTRERIGFPRAASSGDENAMPGTFTKQGKGYQTYDVVEGPNCERVKGSSRLFPRLRMSASFLLMLLGRIV